MVVTSFKKITIHTKTLEDTRDVFIHDGYVFMRQIKHEICTCGPYNTLGQGMNLDRSFNEYKKVKLNEYGPYEAINQIEFYSALYEFQKNKNLYSLVDSIVNKEERTPIIEWVIYLLLNSNYI